MKISARSNSAFNILSQLIIFTAPLITLPKLLSILGVVDFGMMISNLLIWQTVCVLIDFNFQTVGLQKLISVNKSLLRNELGKLFLVRIILFLIGCVLIVGCNLLYFGNLEFINIMCGFLYCFGYLITNHTWFYFREKFYLLAIFNVISRATFVVLVLSAVNDFKDALIIQSVPIIMTGLMAFLIGKHYKEHAFQKDTILQSIQYIGSSKASFLSSFAGYLLSNTSLLIGPYLLSASNFGTFAIIDRIVRIFLAIYGAVNQVLFRRTLSVYESDTSKFTKHIALMSLNVPLIYLSLSIPAGLLALYFSELLLDFDLIEHYIPFFMLIVWSSISVANSILGFHFLQAIGKYNDYGGILLICLICNLVFIILLSRISPIVGTVGGTLVSEMIMFVFLVRVFLKYKGAKR